MKSNRSLRKGVTVFAIVVFLLGWVVVMPPAAAAHGGYLAHDPVTSTFTVSPTGSDDTANIQAAFDGCAADGPGCTVQLTKGTFLVAQIVVHEFSGKFQGMGERWTTVEALPDLPSPTVNPFWAAMPGPQNPWPDMFVFFNGSFAISGITFSDPYSLPGPIWEFPLLWTFNALYSAILIVGGHADVAIDQVTVRGAAGDFFGSNMAEGVYYQGLLIKPGWTNPWGDLFPISGSFRVTDSAFYTVDNAIAVSALLGTHVTVLENTFDTTEYGFVSFDAYDSVLEVIGNRATNVFGDAGVLAFNDYYIVGTLPTRLLVMDNEFWVTGGASGVWLWDFGTVKTLEAVIAHNEFHSDETGFGGVLSLSLTSIDVRENEIRGAGAFGVDVVDGPGTVTQNEIRGMDVGVWIESATGVVVSRNEITDSASWGIAVTVGMSPWASWWGFTAGPTGTLITKNEVQGSGLFDLFWDGSGTGNVWLKNEYKTSSPPNL